MKKQVIIKEITERVESSKSVDYGAWRIGLTHQPAQRKLQHKEKPRDVQYWLHWQADSLSEAEEIESYFINSKQMKGGTGGNLNPYKDVFIYIF